MLIVGIRLVRDQTFKTVDLFVKKLEELEEYAKTMVSLFLLDILLLSLTYLLQLEMVGPDSSTPLGEQYASALLYADDSAIQQFKIPNSDFVEF